MKKYIVFWYEYEYRRKRQKVKKFYVEAYNKMDAVRTAMDKLSLWRSGLGLEFVEVDGYELSQCVIEYKEPIFEKRCKDYD